MERVGKHKLIIIAFIVMIVPLVWHQADAISATIVDYTNFDDISAFTRTGFTYTPTSIDIGGGQYVCRLTPRHGHAEYAGRAFLTNPIALTDDTSFTSVFSFRIHNAYNGGADGLAFVITTAPDKTGRGGATIGYGGIDRSIAVEFDTYKGGGNNYWDPNDNHIGINLNGDVMTSVARRNPTVSLKNGELWTATVSYDGLANLLNVSVSNTPDFSYTVDIPGILGQTNAYFGFTSGSWGASNDHDIYSWQLSTQEQAPVPIPGTVLLLGSGLSGLVFFRRKTNR